MTRTALTLGLLGLTAAAAPAQFAPGGIQAYPNPYAGVAAPPVVNPYSQFAPNFYNRSNQPLSPYLNMLRGGNPAVNYFYGVRPGLPAGGQPQSSLTGGITGSSQIRSGFLPTAASQSQDPVEVPPAGVEVTLPPSGVGPAAFGNRFGPLTGGYPGAAGGGGGAGGTRNGFTGSQPPKRAATPRTR